MRREGAGRPSFQYVYWIFIVLEMLAVNICVFNSLDPEGHFLNYVRTRFVAVVIVHNIPHDFMHGWRGYASHVSSSPCVLLDNI